MGDLNQKFWSQLNSIFRILILFSSHIFIGHSRHFWQTLPSNNWTLSLPFDTKCSQSKHARNAKLQQSNLFFHFFYFFAPASHRHTFTTTFSTKLFDRTPVCRVVLCGAMRGKASCCYFQNAGEQNFEGVRTLKVCQSVSAAFEKGPSFVLSVPSFPPT